MPVVLVGMGRQIAVELVKMALRQWDHVVDVEDRFHDSDVAGDVLPVARRERTDSDVCRQALDLPGSRDVRL